MTLRFLTGDAAFTPPASDRFDRTYKRGIFASQDHINLATAKNGAPKPFSSHTEAGSHSVSLNKQQNGEEAEAQKRQVCDPISTLKIAFKGIPREGSGGPTPPRSRRFQIFPLFSISISYFSSNKNLPRANLQAQTGTGPELPDRRACLAARVPGPRTSWRL